MAVSLYNQLLDKNVNMGISEPQSEKISSAQSPHFSQVLNKIIRQTSKMRFHQHCGLASLELIEVDPPPFKIFAHWMGIILVAGPSIRAVFKVYYNSDDIKNMASATLSSNEKNSPDVSSITDFVKEFCNLMGGGIKSTLEESGILVGVSLPLVTRGFDEIFSVSTSELLHSHDCWMLANASFKVICSFHVEIIDSRCLEQLAAIKENTEVAKEGNVDFL